MERTSINALKDYLRGTSALLGNPDFMILLDVSANNGSGDRVFAELIRLALNEYEKLNPLYLYRILPSDQPEGVYYMDSNFMAYLEGLIDENYVELTPLSIIGSGDSWVYQHRDFTYSPPVLVMTCQPYNNQIYYTARRPVLLSYSLSEDKITDDSFIYFLNINSTEVDRWFLDYLEYQVLVYLRDQKANIMYPDLPIDFMSGLPERLNEVYQRLENYRISPYKHGQLLR